MSTQPLWELSCDRESLRQGDLIYDCWVPVCVEREYLDVEEVDEIKVEVQRADVIVVTQSCDLQRGKTKSVALCPFFSVEDFAKECGGFSSEKPEEFTNKFKGQLESIRKGQCKGLHLLGSPIKATDNKQAIIVDFKEIYSLPYKYLINRVKSLEPRWRLKSPFLENFSRSFGEYFMRVGLPFEVPPYK